ELASVLEQLRATRPAWTADGSRFAFASFTPGPAKDQPGRWSLRLGYLAERRVEQLAEEAEPFRDLCWSPGGDVLGVVLGRDNASLRLIRPGGELSPPVSRGHVRRFAGWNAGGDRLAYVTPDGSVLSEEGWSFLLLPDSRARDAVLV